VYLVVRGYQKTHRLQRGKKTATYLMMPDNLIISKICMTAGIPVTAMPVPGLNEYVLQNNQSDWDFIQERGKRAGFELKTNALGITTFGPRGVPSGTPALLRYGKNLLSFRPRVNAYGQVSAVTVQGWDPKLKMPILGMFVVPPTPLGGNTARTVMDLTASKVFGVAAKKTIADRPVDNMAVALFQATAEAKNIITDFVQAEGECEGNPTLLPGSPVMIMEVGVKYAGPYVLSSVTHTYNTVDGYKTAFSVSGSQPETVSGILEGESRSRATGVVIGVVTNNMDPLQMGRVKVRFPHLGALPPVESNWCRMATASGGMLSGTYFIPERRW
jgi:phage protein D